MRFVRYLIGLFAVGVAVGTGCGSSDEGSSGGPVNKADSGDVATGGTTVSGGTGGSTAGTSGTSAGGSTTGGTGGTTAGAGGITDAGPTGPACTTNADCTAPDQCVFGHCGTVVTATCQGKIYQCGDGLDNDNDGLTDMNDPDCLGPCQNNEGGFIGCISGQNNAPCKMDCWWDQDTGAGNDSCYWDHRCDPLEVAPNYDPHGPNCPYDPNTNVSGAPNPGDCASLQAQQPAQCGSYCGPLTPNGCDCFGCCELPPGSGTYAWVGSTSDYSGSCDMGTCTIGTMTDTTACRPCTPVQSCLNKCEHCELCVGKTELPEDCYSTPDAGPPPPPPDGPCVDQTCAGGGQACNCGEGCPSGLVCSGGCCICPSPLCPTGIQPCGLSCLPACPAGYYCNTGCCQQVPA